VTRPSSEVLFKSLENGVPDVVVHPPESFDNHAVLDFRAGIEACLAGKGYLSLDAWTSPKFTHSHPSCVKISLGSENAEEIRPVRLNQTVSVQASHSGGHQDVPVLIPILYLVEQPECVLVKRLPFRVWAQVNYVDLRNSFDVGDAARQVGGIDRIVLDRERRTTLLFGCQPGAVVHSKTEDELVETAPHTVQRVPDYQRKDVREWLQYFCEESGSPIAIGLLRDSVAIARPIDDHCFNFSNMHLGSGQLTAVAER